MRKLTLKQIKDKIKKTKFSDFDMVVGISRGGIIPAILVSKHLNVPFKVIRIKYRDEDKKPMYKKPRLLGKLKVKGKKILVVDDVSKTGATLEKAKQALKGNKVKTFVINGSADYSLFDFKECVEWGWKG